MRVMIRSIQIISLLIIAICIQSFLPKEQVKRQKASIQEILDSFKVIRQLNAFASGYKNPPTVEELRYSRITLMLFELPLSEARKLMADSSPVARAYGIAVACKKYYKDLNSKDLEIFGDKSKFNMYTQEGIVEFPLELGDFARMMHESMPKEIALSVMEDTAKRCLSAFIRKYATYPKSYSAIGSNISTWNSEDENGRVFVLEHHYTIKRNDNTKVKDTAYFTLDNRYNVKEISDNEEPTSFLSTYNYSDWFHLFGRKLNSSDSSILHLK